MEPLPDTGRANGNGKIAEVVPLAHARTAAAAALSTEGCPDSSSCSSADFSALIAPLEAAAQHSLREPGRGRCLDAFRHDPERFSRLVKDAFDRGRNPLALLVKMVTDRDHLAELPPVNGNGHHPRQPRRYGRGVTAEEVFARAGVPPEVWDHLAREPVETSANGRASACPHCESGAACTRRIVRP